MRRAQLAELEDQQWLPQLLRDCITDLLRAVEEPAASLSPIHDHLRRLLEAGQTDVFVDLCSGSGGPMLVLRRAIEIDTGQPVRLILTDKYPNLPAFEAASALEADRVSYRTAAVDARSVPPDLSGARTLFNALHHFRPDAARAILADAARSRTPIGAFDGTDRTLPSLLAIVVSPLMVLLGTPFLRPFRISRIVLTYVIPVIPVLALWDGLVSCFRSYSPGELQELVKEIAAEGWTWEIGRVPFRRTPWYLTYVLGYPTRDDENLKG